MYLSRLQLNLGSKEVQRDLSNVHGMHQRVLSGFPDGVPASARESYKALYRMDGDNRGRINVLVQSAIAPNWERLPEGYLADLNGDNPSVAELGPALAAIHVGRVYRFRLRANVTKRLRTGTKEVGKRVELIGQEALVAWLERKSALSGFQPSVGSTWGESLLVTEEPKIVGRRKGTTLVFGSTLFEGLLRVTDAETFRAAVTRGLGSGKAYGFGLLSIAPTGGQ